MPYPSGVLTATVTVGDSFTASGQNVQAEVTVTPNFGTGVSRIVHQATGRALTAFPETFTAPAGQPVTFTLPFVDQAGFRDPAGNAFTMWSYTVAVTVKPISGGSPVSYTQILQPVIGQTVIDLDVLPTTTQGLPTTTNVPAVTSVNGQTGAVTVEAGGGGGGAVDSVNGQIGVVVLDANSVGAVPTTRTINTVSPLSGGGALSSNLALGVVDNGITDAKLTDMPQATVKGRALASGTGDPVNLTQTQLMALLTAATTALAGIVPLATNAEVVTGTETTKAATPAGVAAAIAALVGAAPAALNTLSELSDALGDDANFAATVATSLAGKVDENAGGFAVITSLHPGATLTVRKDPVTGFWPASYSTSGAPIYTGGSANAGVRPTSRTDIIVIWKGADPSPAIVSSGTGGMLNEVDLRAVTV